MPTATEFAAGHQAYIDQALRQQLTAYQSMAWYLMRAVEKREEIVLNGVVYRPA